MNPRRILAFAAALAAVAAATAVVIVAASFAVYALARAWLGPAGGAAVVTGVFALIAVVVALVAIRAAKLSKTRAKAAAPPPSPIDQVIRLAKERPLIAAGAAVAAGFVIMRNPALVTALVSAFMAGGSSRPPNSP